MAVRGRQGVVEGQLVWHGVLPITGVRGWGDRMEAHMDHAWLMMRSHAQGETRVHSGELGWVEVGGDDDMGGTTMPARAAAWVPRAQGERGGPARPRGRARLSPVSPPSPPLPKWRLGCSCSRPIPSGNNEQWWLRGRFCS